MLKSKGLIGNSSSGIREAGFYGLPAINLGERQNNRERDINVFNTNYNKKNILKFLKNKFNKKYKNKNLYGNGNATKKIVQIILKII